MSTPIRLMTLTSAISVALMAVAGQSSAHAAAPTSTTAQASASEPYIIIFAETGLLDYAGGVSGLQATATKDVPGQRKLDVHSAASQAYGSWLATQRAQHVSAIASTLGRSLAVTHNYAVTVNGIATTLSAAEAARIATLPGVKSVRPAGEEQVVTYRGPTFMGADKIWDGSATPSGAAGATRGKGIVVGDLDTGTNSTHPSFANDATCDFSASQPKLVAVDCLTTDSLGFCNGPNPEAADGNGHGVHTASTIAGNTIDNTANPAPLLPDGVTMSGVAPCAAIHSYKVCQTTSCDGAQIFAGIQNAIADKVDVLNFSISGGGSPWHDNDRDFLDAMRADVFVAAAAGNLGGLVTDPIGNVNHIGPWLMTVAASSQDKLISQQFSVTAPAPVPSALAAISLLAGSTTHAADTTDLIAQSLRSYPTNVEGCTASGGIPAGTFTGAVAVLRRGACAFSEKISNAASAGATMVLIGNDAAGALAMDTTGAPAIPAFSTDGTTGDALLAFIAANPTTTLGNYQLEAITQPQGDVLADFSLRGPTPAAFADLTKPDITAPGVNIYAATDTADGSYQFMSGTSMATPHMTGAAALVRAVHPDWSVEEVKSAVQTTAFNGGFEEDGVTPWTVDDVGSGRVDLTKAALAGLTLDETYFRFLAANPALGTLDVKALNLASMRNSACTPSCTWTRTVTNKLANAATWNTSFQGTPSLAGTIYGYVTPSTFTLAPGASQVLTITAAPPLATEMSAFGFGAVLLTENAGQSPPQHLSVALMGTGGAAAPDDIFQDGFDGSP